MPVKDNIPARKSKAMKELHMDDPDQWLREVLDRPIAYHVSFARITGSAVAGLMLSQAVYWSNRTRDPEGWFYKTREDWEDETGLTRTEQERARKILGSLSIMEEKRRGVPAKMFYRVNMQVLADHLRGVARELSVDDVLRIFAQTLRGLGRAGHMRAVKAGVEVVENVEYADVLRVYGMTCHICGEPIRYGPGSRGDQLTFDHVTPISSGGSHTLDNLRPAHARCNFSKHSDAQTSLLAVSKLEGLQQADKSALFAPTNTETTAETTAETTETCAADAAQERASNDDDVIMARFDRWYAVYPKKRSKQAAIRAWKKIRPSEQLTEQMIAATEAWKRTEDWTKQHGKFIPYPASWLNAGGWEDQLPGEQQHEQQREQQQRALDDFDPIAFLEREHNGLDDDQLARVNAGAPLESVLTDFQKQHLHEGRMRHAMRREMMRRSQDYV